MAAECRMCPWCKEVHLYPAEDIEQASTNPFFRTNCLGKNCGLYFWPGLQSDIAGRVGSELRSIPALIKVHSLVNNEIPPAVFFLIPRRIDAQELELKVEQFIHIDILPEDLKKQVREVFLKRAERYRAIMEGREWPPKFEGEF